MKKNLLTRAARKGMSLIEIVEESNDCRYHDGETGYGNGSFKLEVKKVHRQRDGNSTTSDSSYATKKHNQGKNERPYPFFRSERP